MIIFKFGGASVSSAQSIRNLASIVAGCNDELIIVISAFGKTTNALENILADWLDGEDWNADMEALKKYHNDIINDLFSGSQHEVSSGFLMLVRGLEEKLQKDREGSYDFHYDQIVSFGELFSTKIVSAFLASVNIINQWIDARDWLITDNTFREANVDYDKSRENIRSLVTGGSARIFVTQGFVGGTTDGYATTLGREGSDYTAAIAANLLDGGKVVVWKDVPGILTADPAIFPEAEKLNELSYQEAIELSYYGAKVIHPKTIKPLQNKNIPLYVKSFLDPATPGTLIHNVDTPFNLKPIIIVKAGQVLISLTPRDFSFVVEDRLSRIFALFFKYRMKVNLLQHSAISFTICMDNSGPFVKDLLEEMGSDFRILYNEDLELITIRHYTQQMIDRHISGREMLVEQRSRNTAMFVVR